MDRVKPAFIVQNDAATTHTRTMQTNKDAEQTTPNMESHYSKIVPDNLKPTLTYKTRSGRVIEPLITCI